MANEAAYRLDEVRANIAKACKPSRRETDDVTLIAVSKTHPAEKITPLLEAGHRVFGENRVQEAQEKWPALREAYPDVELHLIGQLQSNKADEAVALFDCIHGLDRPSLLKALAKAMDKAGKRVPCFIQVNIGEEEQKGGCAIADLPALIEQAKAAEIPILGLMCIPPIDEEAAMHFALLQTIAKRNHLSILSMGMSDDFEEAIAFGATAVRIGSAIFGARDS